MSYFLSDSPLLTLPACFFFDLEEGGESLYSHITNSPAVLIFFMGPILEGYSVSINSMSATIKKLIRARPN